jgi:hypothetical protein
MPEVRDGDGFGPKNGADLGHFLVWQVQETLDQSKLMHDLEGRGMDRIATKITQEIRVFFQNKHLDTGPGQEQTQHHPGGTAADNTDLRRNFFAGRQF